MKLPEPIQPNEVFVDVQPWLAALYAQLPNELVPLTGVLRHAEILSRYFTPAAVVMPGETFHTQGCLERLQEYLGKPVKLVYPDAENGLEWTIYEKGCRLWLSLSPDCSGPAVCRPYDSKERRYLTACILHDTQAVNRVFGEQNKANFLRAMEFTDEWLPVSMRAAQQFADFWGHRLSTEQKFNVKHMGHPPEYIFYSCSHGYEELPSVMRQRDQGERVILQDRRGWISSSLHSVYPHKNLFKLADMVEYLETHHLHVGALVMPYQVEMIQCAEKGVHFVGALSDGYARFVLNDSDVFICLSREEGFSIPPLEAILQGCPRILLSDIAAHREVYDNIPGVVFLDPDEPVESFEAQGFRKVGDLPVVPESYRQMLFNRFKPSEALHHFLDWLKHLAC